MAIGCDILGAIWRGEIRNTPAISAILIEIYGYPPANFDGVIVIAPGQTNVFLYDYLPAKQMNILSIYLSLPGQK